MNPRPPSQSNPGNHFVDIHEVVMEEDEEEDATQTRPPDRNMNNRLNRFREFRPRNHHHVVHRGGFNRQVSLETGFSVLNRDSKARDDRKVLRSGLSLGGLESVNRAVGEGGGKGDFSLFRTKSTLSKQHSLMQLRKDRDKDRDRGDNVVDDRRTNVNETTAVENMDEAVNQSVPAGRYFAALRGPELDEVKVINSSSFLLLSENITFLRQKFHYLSTDPSKLM